MSKIPKYWNEAKKALSRKDPVMRKIIKKYKKGFMSSRNDPFFSLCRTIVGQQISIKAADSIWSKFEKNGSFRPKRFSIGMPFYLQGYSNAVNHPSLHLDSEWTLFCM